MSKTPRARTPRPARGHVQTAAAVLRGLLSLTVLLALLGGLPLLLWWATSVVGPPGMAALGSLFSTDDSGQVFLLALAVAGWIGWALFACAVLLEIPAQLRGRAAPQIRGLVGQRAAATLVGAVLLALPTGTALAAPASAVPATATTGVSAAAVPGTATANSPAGPAASSSETGHGQVTYTVRDLRPAESLWSIAETALGDGQRWEEIAALNEGRTMPGGLVFHTERPIQPGWTLSLPADARPAPSQGTAPQQTEPAPATYTVRPGDSLSTIAAEQLGDPAKYTELFELNQGSPLPGGGTFTDPDLIHPGQHLTLPQPGATTPAAPAAPAQGAGPGTGPTAQAPATPPTAPAPAATGNATPPAPSTGPSSSPHAQPTAEAAPTPAAEAPATSGQARDTSINWALIAGIGTLLAASLAAALGVRRILQQRQRRAGETIAQDQEPAELEQLLAATSQPAGVELLDRALRTLAHHAADQDLTLPALRGARLGAAGVTLLLDEPAAPIAPFAGGPALAHGSSTRRPSSFPPKTSPPSRPPTPAWSRSAPTPTAWSSSTS